MLLCYIKRLTIGVFVPNVFLIIQTFENENLTFYSQIPNHCSTLLPNS